MPELGRLKNLRTRSADIQKQLKSYNKLHKSSSSASTKNLKRISEAENEIGSGKKSLEKLGQVLEFIADGHSLEEMIALHAGQKRACREFC